MRGYKEPKEINGSILGLYDKIVGFVFGSVMVALLLWVVAQTHSNTVALAEVSTGFEDYKALYIREGVRINKQLAQFQIALARHYERHHD